MCCAFSLLSSVATLVAADPPQGGAIAFAKLHFETLACWIVSVDSRKIDHTFDPAARAITVECKVPGAGD